MPGGEDLRGEVHHDRSVTGDLLTMEGRLAQPALAQPEIPFAREEAAPKHRFHVAPKERVLDEVAVIRDEDVLHVIGVIQEIGHAVGKPQPHDIPILARTLGDEAEQILAKLRQVAEEEMPLRSGREATRALIHRSCSLFRELTAHLPICPPALGSQ